MVLALAVPRTARRSEESARQHGAEEPARDRRFAVLKREENQILRGGAGPVRPRGGPSGHGATRLIRSSTRAADAGCEDDISLTRSDGSAVIAAREQHSACGSASGAQQSRPWCCGRCPRSAMGSAETGTGNSTRQMDATLAARNRAAMHSLKEEAMSSFRITRAVLQGSPVVEVQSSCLPAVIEGHVAPAGWLQDPGGCAPTPCGRR